MICEKFRQSVNWNGKRSDWNKHRQAGTTLKKQALYQQRIEEWITCEKRCRNSVKNWRRDQQMSGLGPTGTRLKRKGSDIRNTAETGASSAIRPPGTEIGEAGGKTRLTGPSSRVHTDARCRSADRN
jgi:hypothetical protein